MPLSQFGKYQLVRPLAQGGMAEIWLAIQSGMAGFQKLVVIKRVLPHLALDPGFVQMFLDEARLAARLNHPGIVQTFDFGETDGRYFLAMEYLAGEELGALLKAERQRRSFVPPPVAARIVASVCDALHYAHTLCDETGRPLHIIHRDVSPSNVFLTFAGTVKVLDFGLAKAEGRQVQTRGGVLKGKYLYMSPEQIDGKPLDCRSDVFALGALLHEMLAGQPTFLRNSELLMLKAIVEEPVTPLRDLVPGIPPELDEIVLKALERPVARRFQSALEMRNALDAFLTKSQVGSSLSELQDYVRGLVPEEVIAKKKNPLFAAGPQPARSADDDDVDVDRAPTERRLSGSMPVATQPGEPSVGAPPPTARRPDLNVTLVDAGPAPELVPEVTTKPTVRRQAAPQDLLGPESRLSPRSFEPVSGEIVVPRPASLLQQTMIDPPRGPMAGMQTVLMAPDDPEESHQTARMPGTDSVEAQQTVLGAPRPPELMQTAVDEKMPRLPWPREAEAEAEAEEGDDLQRAGLSRWRSHPFVVVGAVVALVLVAALAVWLFSSR